MPVQPNRFITIAFTTIAVCLGSTQVWGVSPRKTASTQNRIESVYEKAGLKADQLGLYVIDGQGRELVDVNSKRAFIPASLTKIITTAAILNTWPQSHQFTTQVLIDSEIKNRTLQGSLYLRGGGDPSLVSERMWYLVNVLAREEISTIEGDLVVDESRFDSIRFDEGRDEPVDGRAFDAPISALSFNWNSVNVFVRPGAAPGDSLIVKTDPPNDYILGVDNNAKTVKAGATEVQVKRVPVKKDGAFIGDRVVVTGKMAVGAPEFVVYRAITEPDLWTGHNFIQFLKQRNITVKGKVRKGTAPSTARLFVEAPGADMRSMVIDMMKFSNNYMAEILVKNMSVEKGQKPGTMEVGLEQVRKYLDGIKISRSQYSITSPSGLSRRNQVTPQAIGKVLTEMKDQFSAAPEFLASLPVAGIDGTLKRRMMDPPAKGWVRAKTGLLNGVAGLAGYVGRPDGDVLTFVFIYNGPKSDQARVTFDRMCYALMD